MGSEGKEEERGEWTEPGQAEAIRKQSFGKPGKLRKLATGGAPSRLYSDAHQDTKSTEEAPIHHQCTHIGPPTAKYDSRADES